MNDVEKTLTEYVKTVDRIGHPAMLENFVLKHGRAYQQAPLADLSLQGPARMCFRNATIAALDRFGGIYTEGFAIAPGLGIPIHHAWLTIDNAAVDVTWNYTGCSYFGIEFPNSDVRYWTVHNGYYGILSGEMINVDLMRERDPDFVAERIAKRLRISGLI